MPRSVISCLRPVEIDRSSPEHGFEVELTGYDIVRACPDALDLAAAIALVEEACAPPADDRVLKMLGAVRAMTVARAGDTDNLKLVLRLYADEIKAYPADVVEYVLATQAGISKWWPTWHELKERLDLYAGARHLLRRALGRLAARSVSCETKRAECA